MIKSELKIVFMGTPEIAAKVFLDMINDGYNFVGLIAQEDKPVGRKKLLLPVPTKSVALEHGIKVFQPHKIREDYEFVKDLKPDIIITLAYGQIVPQGLLDIPKFGCLNLHGSLLPKYRGAAPIQRCIENGDNVTGVTLMEMVDKMDAGKMYAKEEVEILSSDNYSSLREKISVAASKLIIRELPNYIDGKLPGEEQNEELVTFANKILPEEEKLELGNCSSFINKVRCLSYEPGGYVYLEDKKFKILKATKFDDKIIGEIGQIYIEKYMIIQLKDGRVILDEIQPEGKSKMDGRSFINGHKDLNGKIIK